MTTFVSFELLLLRREAIQCSEDEFVHTSPILVTEIATGPVKCGIQVPFYMIFPRDFVIRTLMKKHFKIEFFISFNAKFGGDGPSKNSSIQSDKIPIIMYH